MEKNAGPLQELTVLSNSDFERLVNVFFSAMNRLATKPQTKKALNTEEAAEYLGIVKARTLEKWRKIGKGPRFVDLDGQIGYTIKELDSYLEQKMKDPAKDFECE